MGKVFASIMSIYANQSHRNPRRNESTVMDQIIDWTGIQIGIYIWKDVRPFKDMFIKWDHFLFLC